MTDELTFDALRKANVERCEESYHPLKDWHQESWLMALTGELGEIAHVLKDDACGEYPKANGIPMESDLADELADLVIYADLLAARCGIDLGEAIRFKFDRTSRKIGSEVRLTPSYAPSAGEEEVGG